MTGEDSQCKLLSTRHGWVEDILHSRDLLCDWRFTPVLLYITVHKGPEVSFDTQFKQKILHAKNLHKCLRGNNYLITIPAARPHPLHIPHESSDTTPYVGSTYKINIQDLYLL